MSLATVNRAATIVLAAAGTMLMSAPAAMAATYDCNTPGHTLSVVIDWFEVQQGDLVGYPLGRCDLLEPAGGRRLPAMRPLGH